MISAAAVVTSRGSSAKRSRSRRPTSASLARRRRRRHRLRAAPATYRRDVHLLRGPVPAASSSSPTAFIMRMTRALERADREPRRRAARRAALTHQRARSWNELRAARECPSGRIIALPSRRGRRSVDRAIGADRPLPPTACAHRPPARHRPTRPGLCASRRSSGATDQLPQPLLRSIPPTPTEVAVLMARRARRKMTPRSCARWWSDALTGGGHEIAREAANGAEAVQRVHGPLRPDIMTLWTSPMPEKERAGRPEGDHRRRSRREGRHVLGAGPGVQGARVDQARRQRDFVVKPFQVDRVPVGRGEGAGLVPAP